MKSVDDIRLVNVLHTDSREKVEEEAIGFWKKHKVILKEEVLRQRASELVMVAYDDHNSVIATSTGPKTKVKLLNNNWLYQYRCFIDPNFRVIGFDVHLTLKSLQSLEEAATSDRDHPIGVFVVVENPSLHNDKVHSAAVWRAYQMYFIGYNTKGQPIRVFYFKGAMI
ncbi:MAG: hypothetical protein WAU36_15745 [Cyclobacteriaceae bacterium]